MLGNFVKNEGRSMELVNKDVLALLVHDIITELELVPSSTIDYFFVDANMLDLELAKEMAD